MKYCVYCGGACDDESLFCPKCGRQLPEEKTAQSTAKDEGWTSVDEQPVSTRSSPVMRSRVDAARPAKKKRGCTAVLATFIAFAVFCFIGYSLVKSLSSGWSSSDGSGQSSYGDYTTQYTSDGVGVYGESLGLDGLRDRYTAIKGDGTDTVTVMVYMCGSNLESESGCGTNDLLEMIDASKTSAVNVVVQTGGAKKWMNDTIGLGNERYLVTESGLQLLDDSLGKLDMTRPSTLADFIKFCASEYPANRYMLVMWDHGGGTMGGFGYDELSGSGGTMSLAGIDEALEQGGVKFDIVGFDACLMATLENAYMLEPHADYLIASEEVEPGDGWYYTDWIEALNDDPGISSKELGVKLIDSFVGSTGRDAQATLSMCELRELPYLYGVLCDYLSEARTEISGMEFAGISRARSNAKSYGENGYDQIDLADFATKAALDGTDKVLAAINSAVIYRNASHVNIANGLAAYFPYSWLENYSSVLSVQQQIGMDDSYTGFYRDFVSVMAGGQISSSTSTETPAYGDYDWFNSSLIDSYNDYYAQNSVDETELTIDDKGEYYALHMSAEEWALISGLELQVFLDDGQGGYIDLGSDNVWEFDDDGDLKVNFDYTWVAVNGQTVCFYNLYEQDNDDYWYTYGYSPATINGSDAKVILRWDTDNPSGYVAGYQIPLENGLAPKELMQFKKGDVIQFGCDYYLSDGTYDATYDFNDPITYNGSLEVSYEDVGDYDTLVCYQLTDIYGAKSWTEWVQYTVD